MLQLMFKKGVVDVRKASQAFKTFSARTACCSPHWRMSALLQAWQTCCHSTTLLQGRKDVSNLGLSLSSQECTLIQQLTNQLNWMWVEQESANQPCNIKPPA
jgi:hypothetical protein